VNRLDFPIFFGPSGTLEMCAMFDVSETKLSANINFNSFGVPTNLQDVDVSETSLSANISFISFGVPTKIAGKHQLRFAGC